MKQDYDSKVNKFRCQKPTSFPSVPEEKLNGIYNVMRQCWDIDPENRPKFYNLQVDLDHFTMTGELLGYSSMLAADTKDMTTEEPGRVKAKRTFSQRIKNEPFSSLIN